jgi:hypothetical protein
MFIIHRSSDANLICHLVWPEFYKLQRIRSHGADLTREDSTWCDAGSPNHNPENDVPKSASPVSNQMNLMASTLFRGFDGDELDLRMTKLDGFCCLRIQGIRPQNPL